MKTITYLSALEKARKDQKVYYTMSNDNPYYRELFGRRIRQSFKFEQTLLTRIEKGDRARGWMDWIEYELLTDPNVKLEQEIKDVIKWYRMGR